MFIFSARLPNGGKVFIQSAWIFTWGLVKIKVPPSEVKFDSISYVSTPVPCPCVHSPACTTFFVSNYKSRNRNQLHSRSVSPFVRAQWTYAALPEHMYAHRVNDRSINRSISFIDFISGLMVLLGHKWIISVWSLCIASINHRLPLVFALPHPFQPQMPPAGGRICSPCSEWSVLLLACGYFLDAVRTVQSECDGNVVRAWTDPWEDRNLLISLHRNSVSVLYGGTELLRKLRIVYGNANCEIEKQCRRSQKAALWLVKISCHDIAFGYVFKQSAGIMTVIYGRLMYVGLVW